MEDMDRFDDIISEYLVPTSKLGPQVEDPLYLLHNDGSFVYSQGYYHPPGAIFGKVINYPCPGGSLNFHGRDYESIAKPVEEGVRQSIANDFQAAEYIRLHPELTEAARKNLITDYHFKFPLADFQGYFDNRGSLKTAMAKRPQLRGTIEELSDMFKFPIENMGCTGSLVYGRLDDIDEDVDVVFYGTVKENRRVLDMVYELQKDPDHRIFEYGRYWPIRFIHKGTIICTFYNYIDWDEVPLPSGCGIKLVEENVTATFEITNADHSVYMPLVFKIKDCKVNGEEREIGYFYIYDSSIRGEYFEGEIFEVKGKVIIITRGEESFDIILTTIRHDIKKLREVPIFGDFGTTPTG